MYEWRSTQYGVTGTGVCNPVAVRTKLKVSTYAPQLFNSEMELVKRKPIRAEARKRLRPILQGTF